MENGVANSGLDAVEIVVWNDLPVHGVENVMNTHQIGVLSVKRRISILVDWFHWLSSIRVVCVVCMICIVFSSNMISTIITIMIHIIILIYAFICLSCLIIS